MTETGRTASTIRRLGSGASRRITEGLLSSSELVAGVGVVTAVLTLGFAIWFGLELRYQSGVGAPLTHAAAVMNAAINRSLAELRGWVAYGQPSAKEARARIWTEEIEPTLGRLDALSKQSDDAEAEQSIAELHDLLRDLKLVQWAIEDVAQTPGNRPAAVAYETRLRPLRTIILRSLHAAIEQYSLEDEGERAIDFVADLARLRSAFTQADLALSENLVDFDEVRVRTTQQHLEQARTYANEIQGAGIASGDLLHVIDLAIQEFYAYDTQVQEIIALRRSAQWNVAHLLYVRDALPLVVRARALSGHLAKTQASDSQERASTLTDASYFVIAMALVMGLLSGGSLLVSYRLRQQVQHVIAKAKRLGQYEMEKRIGQGGMGEVYLAHHAMLRRPTAIKLLRSANAQDVRAQQRFQREVQLTCQLTHPNTIEIFDYGRTPQGIFYYAMEFVDGFTLESLVALAGPTAPSRVIHVLVQACGSLHEAHEHGLLHRDIKPSNIMLTHRGGVYDTVKILDFGLVKDLGGDDPDDQKDEEVIAGTPMYLAPEIILSPNSASPKSDIYALGAVAYFLLSGTTVIDSNDLMQILARQIDEQVPFPSERLGHALPEDLEYVVMSCLAKDPADRPSSAEHLAELLRACDEAPWTQKQARMWWDQYGEAARSTGVTEAKSGSGIGSAIEVVVDPSRV